MVKTFVFELPCLDGRKSFYGKAHVIRDSNGWRYLQSYDTLVCGIDSNGRFRRFWDGYSLTTMRHVNSFCRFFRVSDGGKAWWNSLEVES